MFFAEADQHRLQRTARCKKILQDVVCSCRVLLIGERSSSSLCSNEDSSGCSGGYVGKSQSAGGCFWENV